MSLYYLDSLQALLPIGSSASLCMCKVLNKDAMFDLDKGDKCEAQFVHNTSGLCSREDFTKKRKEIKGKESQKKEKRTKKAKKATSMLSFDVQEDE